jgi:hypothetical protein
VVSPYARCDPTRTGRPSCRDGYAILEGGVGATSAGDPRGRESTAAEMWPPGSEMPTTARVAAALETQGICRPEADALTARARQAMLGDAIVPKLFGQRDVRSLSNCAGARTEQASPRPPWRDSGGPAPWVITHGECQSSRVSDERTGTTRSPPPSARTATFQARHARSILVTRSTAKALVNSLSVCQLFERSQ